MADFSTAFKTFTISFRLKNTYRTNGIIYSLKSIPLVRRLLPSSLYSSRGLKIFANIFSVLWELVTTFGGKLLYLILLFLAINYVKASPADSYAHILIFLSIAGGYTNTRMFDPTKDKFYAMFIMRINPHLYTLTDFFYFLIKMIVGFLPTSILIGKLCGAELLTCLSLPVFVVSLKLCFAVLTLKKYEKSGKIPNENKLSPKTWLFTALLLAAAFAPPFFGFALSETVLCVLTLIGIVPAVFAVSYILRYPSYRKIYRELLTPGNMILSTSKSDIAAAQQLSMQKKITADTGLTSNKTGYLYFNELFMKRHSKLLTRSAKRIALGAAILLAVAVVACFIFPKVREVTNDVALTFLPYFLFVMYLLNRGKIITQAMFINCDHSMLTYRFYRKPGAILTLFVARLKYVVLINLMPAVVIALGLPLLLYITGGTDNPLNYLLLFVSIIAMSVFFSVHNMVLYYLLQPYNINLEAKSAVYSIVSYVTYMACYIAIGKEVSTLIFGTIISAFCIIYVAVAFVLAYHLAPKTFKLRV